MSITLRNIKGSELTFSEVDENFKSFFYTASLDSNILKLTYFNPPNDVTQEINLTPILGDTGSFFVNATVNKNNITFTRGDGNILTKTIQIFPFDGDAEITGSLTVTKNLFISASENSTIQNIALYDTASGELFYTSSNAVGGGGSGATLSQELKPNVTVGGVDSSDTFAQGSTIEALLRTMLITFQSSTLGNFTLQDQFGNGVPFGVVEANTSYNFEKVTITATANDPNGNFPVTSSFQVSNATSGDFTEFLGNGPLVSSNQITFSSPKTVTADTFSGNKKVVTYKFTAKDPDSLSNLNKSRSQTYVYPIYYGNTALDLTNVNVEGNLQKDIITKPNFKSVFFNFQEQFIYFCYPKRYGSLVKIEDNNNFDLTNSFIQIERNQSGAAGWSGVEYYIYKYGLTSVDPPGGSFKFYWVI